MLILAATPIGNIEDASPRLRRVLAEADAVFAEDTRHARKLLTRLEIDRPTASFHDHSGESGLHGIGKLLDEGRTVVYISDAGMPGINDPGYELVRLARDRDAEVDVIPGPCAAINALVLSGLPTHHFCFLGFFPTTVEKRAAMIERLRLLNMTAVFFEGPSRIVHALEWLSETIPQTQIAVCRELTKRHQQVLCGTPGEVREALEMVKGEFCLVIGPVRESSNNADIGSRYKALLDRGESPTRAVKQLSKELRLPKREVYAMVHDIYKNDDSS
ncbi:MAG: 16S rRNA (cytidine(1402)-2'-O)-methyltransferase [Acidobacteriota bacterium]|nr:16S rRNA (cytidine(1402)-2'-O)-methyltransferase [Acidobacteriota bacterium]